MKTSRVGRIAPLPSGVEVDLVKASAHKTLAHGVESEVDRLLGLLGSGRRHPVLVGPSEVGKSAIVAALARRIAGGARPAGATAVWQVSLRTLDAQVGKDEGVGQRLTAILEEAAVSPARPIVFVRDLRMLRALDAQHQFVEALGRTDALFIGEGSQQFTAWLAEDSELASVVHVVRVEEPTAARTLELLRLQARVLLERDRITVDEAALERIVRHGEQLMPQRRFPGKAFALLDEAAREAASQADRRVTASRVTERVCETLRLPRFLIDPDASFDVAGLTQYLRDRIVGQEDAIDAVVQSLALYKADLADSRRPLGVLMFAGPSGVGKTMLARHVAEYVFGSASRLVRISLAEHSEDWKVDQLFGQRSAQSVDSRRGLLARQLAGKPFSVLLFDEVEKAHSVAYKYLLRPLDEGCYVNGNDEEISLRNTLVILTSSVGSDVYREPGVGFNRGESAGARVESVRKRVADMLPYDLLDRIDRVCVCPPLVGGELREVARREIDAALRRAVAGARALTIEIDDEVLARVIASASVVGNASGARAVRRAVERTVVAPLALYILRTEPAPGTQVRVSVCDGVIVPSSLAPPPALRRTRSEIRIGSRPRPTVAPAVLATSASTPVVVRASARRISREPRE